MAGFDDERIKAIVLGPRAFRTIEFPGHPDIAIAIRSLNEREVDACRVEAQSQFRRMCDVRKWSATDAMNIDPLTWSRLVERQVVWRSTFDPNTIADAEPKFFFASDSIVAELDTITVDRLYAEYLDHREWVSPTISLEAAQVEELIEALGKEQDPEAALTRFDHVTLRRLLISTVRLRSTSRTGKSHTSSPVSTPSNDSDADPIGSEV